MAKSHRNLRRRRSITRTCEKCNAVTHEATSGYRRRRTIVAEFDCESTAVFSAHVVRSRRASTAPSAAVPQPLAVLRPGQTSSDSMPTTRRPTLRQARASGPPLETAAKSRLVTTDAGPRHRRTAMIDRPQCADRRNRKHRPYRSTPVAPAASTPRSGGAA